MDWALIITLAKVALPFTLLGLLPPLVMGIGVATGLHLVNAMAAEGGAGATSLRRVGQPCALGPEHGRGRHGARGLPRCVGAADLGALEPGGFQPRQHAGPRPEADHQRHDHHHREGDEVGHE